MISLAQILLGLVIGLLGFHEIAVNPSGGFCAMLLSGFFVLTGLDRMLRARPKASGTREPG